MCRANQWTGFYMIGTTFIIELMGCNKLNTLLEQYMIATLSTQLFKTPSEWPFFNKSQAFNFLEILRHFLEQLYFKTPLTSCPSPLSDAVHVTSTKKIFHCIKHCHFT